MSLPSERRDDGTLLGEVICGVWVKANLFLRMSSPAWQPPAVDRARLNEGEFGKGPLARKETLVHPPPPSEHLRDIKLEKEEGAGV